MRKLLIVLFLYSLVSGTAFAKVEIWDCKSVQVGEISDLSFLPNVIYKIDTKVPTVYKRDEGKWRLNIVTGTFTYDKENNTVIWNYKNKYKGIYDLIANTYELYVDGVLFQKDKCHPID